MNLRLLIQYVSTKRLHDFGLCQTACDKLSYATALYSCSQMVLQPSGMEFTSGSGKYTEV